MSSILSYNGVPIITPSPEIMAWVSANISTRELFDFQHQAWPGKNNLGIPFPGMTRTRPVTPHTLYWPTGASRFAVGYFFASSNELNLIRAFSSQGQYQSYPFVMGDGVRPNITTNLWMLPPRPLGIAFPGANGLYLLTLVDDRYWWWFNSTGALTVTANTTTWAQLYTSLGTQLNVNIQADPINSAYIKPSSTLTSNYEYVPLLLDAIAYNVGQRIVRQFDGSVHAWNVGTSQNQLTNNLNLSPPYVRAGGALQVLQQFGLADAPAVLPATVQVNFPTDGGTGSPASKWFAVQTTLASLNLANIGSTGAPFTKHFHGSDTATFTGSGTPSNNTELVALAKQIATDWYQYQASSLDLKYNGIIPWVPEGLSDSIEWTYSASPKDLSTRIQRPAWNDQTMELMNGEPPAAATTTAKIGRQIFTGAGTYTYTPTAGTVAILIQACGAGGAGGGSQSTAGSQWSVGGGGGGGAYTEVFVTPISGFATLSVHIGAGGTGSAGSSGSDGGNTTVSGTGVNITAFGGKGGESDTTLTAPYVVDGGKGGLPSPSGADISAGGGVGGYGTSIALTTAGLGGVGGHGSGPYGGGGGWTADGATTPGGTGQVYGGGGSGAISDPAASAQAGGNGADGIVVIWEYNFA